jgi:hypothetical protein
MQNEIELRCAGEDDLPLELEMMDVQWKEQRRQPAAEHPNEGYESISR